MLTGATPSLYFLGFRVTEEPFDEPDVRRAVSLAIDREAMAEAVQGTTAEPARSLVSPLLRPSPTDTCSACEQRQWEARQLFREHGVTSLTFTFSTEGGHQAIANQLRRDLREVGVSVVRFTPLPFEDYLGALDDGAAAFFRFGWEPEHPTAGDLLEPLFAAEGAHNYFDYENERFERLMADGRASVAPGLRTVLHYLAEQQVVDRDQVVVPLIFYRHQLVVDDRVEGFVLDPMGLTNLEEVRLRPGS